MKLAAIAIWQCGLKRCLAASMTEKRLRLNESRLTGQTKGTEVESSAIVLWNELTMMSKAPEIVETQRPCVDIEVGPWLARSV